MRSHVEKGGVLGWTPSKTRYNTILGIDLLIGLGLNLENLVTPLVEVMDCLKCVQIIHVWFGFVWNIFKNTIKITPEEYFTNAYIEEVL